MKKQKQGEGVRVTLDDLPTDQDLSIIREMAEQTRHYLHELGIFNDGSKEEIPSKEKANSKEAD